MMRGDSGDRTSASTLDGQVVIVTGASRGIGAAIAARLAREGARVVCVARTEAEGDHRLPGSLTHTMRLIRAEGGEATAVALSIDTDDACRELVQAARDAYGQIDALVNNAAVGVFGDFTELKVSHWQLSLRLNCHAPFMLSQLVLPEMIERGAGRIVNITSESAVGPGQGPYDLGVPPLGDTIYGAQKALLERLTQGLAQEVYPAGVGVCALAPSQIVPTPGALLNKQVTGEEDARAEPSSFMADAVALLLTQPLDQVSGRVVYSQQLLLEHNFIRHGAGLGADPAVAVSGYSRR
jgi:citronellol/citronellal dehydrogenase